MDSCMHIKQRTVNGLQERDAFPSQQKKEKTLLVTTLSPEHAYAKLWTKTSFHPIDRRKFSTFLSLSLCLIIDEHVSKKGELLPVKVCRPSFLFFSVFLSTQSSSHLNTEIKSDRFCTQPVKMTMKIKWENDDRLRVIEQPNLIDPFLSFLSYSLSLVLNEEHRRESSALDIYSDFRCWIVADPDGLLFVYFTFFSLILIIIDKAH